MRVHATIVSWVFLLYGLAGLALGVGLLLFYGGVGTAALVEEQQIGVFAGFWGIALALGGVVIAISLPNVVAGAGLLLRRPWARPLGFGLAILNLVFAPIGTLFGAYALVALLDDSPAPRR
ncbi:MAG: hypothetical protein U0234_25380 [Sandaracinus sp.]